MRSMPVSVVPPFYWASASSSTVTDTVPSVVVIVAGSVEDLTTTGEDDSHASGLEEVLIWHSVNGLVNFCERNLRGSTSR